MDLTTNSVLIIKILTNEIVLWSSNNNSRYRDLISSAQRPKAHVDDCDLMDRLITVDWHVDARYSDLDKRSCETSATLETPRDDTARRWARKFNIYLNPRLPAILYASTEIVVHTSKVF